MSSAFSFSYPVKGRELCGGESPAEGARVPASRETQHYLVIPSNLVGIQTEVIIVCDKYLVSFTLCLVSRYNK